MRFFRFFFAAVLLVLVAGPVRADHGGVHSAAVPATAPADGYWLVASDGGLFSFGNAMFHGSIGATRLSRPMAGMASTIIGRGYWTLANDGDVFSLGDAMFHASTGPS